MTTRDDHRLAVDLAAQAGALLLELRDTMGFGDPDALRKAGDLRSHEFLLAQLAGSRPRDAVLSEEGASSEDRLDSARVWIVDPLDGTREFGEPGRSDWAVHVALCVDGLPVAGAVALPAVGQVWSTFEPARGGLPGGPPGASPVPRIAVSRTRPGWAADLVRAGLDGELVPMGSAGAKAMSVLRGEAEVYAHSGGQFEWDSAAPVAVALAHGAHATRLDGSALTYNNPDPYLPDLLIAHPAWAQRALAALAAAIEQTHQ